MRKQIVAVCLSATMLVSEFMVPVTSSAAVNVQNVQISSDTLSKGESGLEITKFNLVDNAKFADYNAEYKVKVASISNNNNNGCYDANSKLEYAIDGDFNTHWETNRRNSDSFTNELELTLEEETKIGSIVYSARRASAAGKGFPTTVSIYGATVQGDYSLIGTGSYTGKTTDIVEMSFAETNVKYIKFVFDVADQQYASASEVQVYKVDQLRRDMTGLFTDGTCMEVSKEYADINKLNNLKTQTENHPLKEDYQDDINLAIEIMNGQLDTKDRVITVNQNGNVAARAAGPMKLAYGAASNYQSTGIAALAGETVTVYVDVENEKYMPSLKFTQLDGDNSGWWQDVQLKKGKNVITVPSQTNSLHYNPEWAEPVNAGGAIYIYNGYTKEEQGRAPVIRIEGGECFPLLKMDSDNEEFIQKLKDYVEKVNADAAIYPDIRDRKVLDIFEFEQEHLIFTGTATGAYDAFVTKGRNPHEVMQSWDTCLNRIFEFAGMDGVDDNGNYLANDDPTNVKEHIFIAQHVGWMVACQNHIGIWSSQVSDLLDIFEGNRGSWGIVHEIGHTMDIEARKYTDSTNNMYPMFAAMIYGDGYSEHRVPFESFTYKQAFADVKKAFYTEQDYFEKLGAYWQLELYQSGYWGKLESTYRVSAPSFSAYENDPVRETAKEQEFVIRSSNVLGLDLSEYFVNHGFTVTDETKELLEKYPKCGKIWYLNDGAYKYDGDGLAKDAEASVSSVVDEDNNKITLKFSMEDSEKNDLLGYEIYKDGKLIAFTSQNTYTDENVDLSNAIKYSVIPYGYDLSTAKEVEIDTMAPNITIEKDIVIGLNDEFEPLKHAFATDYKGNIIDGMKVDSKVDVTKKGTYKVTYSITDNGRTVSKTTSVEVISEKGSLTSFDWTDIKTGYGEVRKDRNLNLRVDGVTKSFDTGIYLHAVGEVTYDLTDVKAANYDTFATYVGVDQTIEPQNYSSINFIFYLDGKKVYETPVLNYYSEAEYVKFPLGDANTLKIVVDKGGNNNTSDHAIIGGMNLFTQNACPKIDIPGDIAINVGDSINVYEDYSAYDAEDGDLTNKVSITENIDTSKAGNYKVVYTVCDSDGNKTTKTRKITVCDMSEYETLAADDVRKIVSINGYGQMGINMSIDKNPLRLTDEDGSIVEYKTGLGVHANSTVCYDISGGDYDFFTVDAGVDRECYGNANTSLKMQVYCDDKLAFDSGVLTSKMPLSHVKVNVKGVSKLKLYVDMIERNANDHADWCDLRLYSTKDTLNDSTINGTDIYEKKLGDGAFVLDAASDQGLKLSYESTDANVAQVDENGKVSVKGIGTCKIKISALSNETYKGCNKDVVINVTEKKESNISGTSTYEKTIGDDDFVLDAVSNQGLKLVYVSDNVNVAQVNENGKVTLKGVGVCKISVDALETEQYKGCVKEIVINVKEKESPVQTKKESSISGRNAYERIMGDNDFQLDVVSNEGLNLYYKSDNENIVQVDTKGKVTIKGAGTCKISVSTLETEEYRACVKEILIIIKEKEINVQTQKESSIRGTSTYEKLLGDEPFVLDVVSDQGLKLIYTSDNMNVAQVDENGKVIIKGAGTCKLSVYTLETEEYKSCEKEIVINVSEPAVKIQKESSISGTSTYEKTIGDEDFVLDAVSDQGMKLVYASDNANVAQVDAYGKVTIKSSGTCKIRVSAFETEEYKGSNKEISIIVKEKDTPAQAQKESNISGTDSYEKTFGDKEFLLDAKSNEGLKLVYASDDENVVSVDESGKVTINGSGKATITVSTVETTEYKESTYKITVNVARKNQNIKVKENIVVNGDAKPFSIDAVCDGNGELKYTSSNSKIVTVDEKGMVTVVGAGTAKITVEATQTLQYCADTKVVKIVVNGVKQRIRVAKNKTKTYGKSAFKIGAKNYSGGKMSYKSSNTKVVKVNKKGKVTIKGAGTAVITITASATGIYRETIRVVNITINPKKASIKSVSRSKRKIKLKWKKQLGITGYQIQYSKNKKFKKPVKVTVKSRKTTSKLLSKKIKSGKYYVRIRAYKKDGKRTVYGMWSNKKCIRIK